MYILCCSYSDHFTLNSKKYNILKYLIKIVWIYCLNFLMPEHKYVKPHSCEQVFWFMLMVEVYVFTV